METHTLPWDSLPAELAARIAADLSTPNRLDGGGTLTDGELIAELRRLSKKAAETRRDYARDLVELAQWLVAERGRGGLLDLRTPDLVRYFDHLETDARRLAFSYQDEAGRDRELVLRSGALGPSSLKGQRSAQVALFEHASRMGYRDYSHGNPTFGLELPGVVTVPGLTLSKEERRAILAAEGSERCRAQAYTFTFLPVRVGVLPSLQWADIDFENDTVTLTRGKHGVAGQLPLHRELKAALLRWRDVQQGEALELAADGKPAQAEALADPLRERVFLSANGLPLAKSTFGKQIKWRARRAGVKLHPEGARVSRENTSRAHNHCFRRSWARDLRRQGVQIARIKDGLQHRYESTTIQHYAFGDAPELRETFEMFEL